MSRHNAHARQVQLRSGVSISQLGLGTAPLGGLYTSLDETDVASAIYAALDAGITYIDTAPHYGKGTAERRLGRYFAGFPRASFTLSTKVGRLLVPASNLPDNDFVDADQSVERVFDFSAAGVERSLEESLVRLGLDQVEIVFIHDPDDHADQAISQAYPALERMRSQGMIKSIGVGMNQSAIPTRFIKETDIDIVLIAGRYSLLDQSAAADLLPAALARGVDVIAAGVFNSGILANPGEGAMYNYSPADAEILRRAQVMKALLADFGIPITQAALQFPLRHPAVKAVLVGCRSGHEVRSNIESFNQEIPEDAWSALAELHLEIV